MRAVAQRLVRAVLATAEIDALAVRSFPLHRLEVTTLMRTIAEGLLLALAAGAPEVALARLDLDRVRSFLCDVGLHCETPVVGPNGSGSELTGLMRLQTTAQLAHVAEGGKSPQDGRRSGSLLVNYSLAHSPVLRA